MILALLQARASSRRLPGKVLLPILGRPMLERQIERVGRARSIDRLAIATSTDASDDAIAALAARLGLDCHRGSLEDVLERFYQAARPYRPTHVVRLTGDCPLADPEVIDRVVHACVEGGYDYASNALRPSYPDGLDAEIMRFEVLEAASGEASLPSEREHVTSFIYKRPHRFRVLNVSSEKDLSALRWTVDEPEDFDLVTRIYEALYPANPAFGTDDILALIAAHPEVAGANARTRNEGYLASLERDRALTGEGKP